MTVNPAESISTFYSGQSILLTGATGFLGKVFFEKVLRSCPDVREIFLLMRPNRESNINERLKKILNLPLYEKLCKEQSSNFEKLVPIFGDVSEKGLGLSAADRQMLVKRVTIIIHAAGDVKFSNSLKYAIFANTRSTRDVCILAKDMKNLIALVYVSTAYTNVDKEFIEEKVYSPVADWQKMIQMAESLDEHILNIFSAKCLDYIPNTYIFSKNLAESIIQDYSSYLPCAIVRPSIVTSTLIDPFPGWIDNVYGPIGLFIAGGKGIIKVGYCDKYVRENVVPVDIVIKTILTASWKVGLNTTSFTANSTPFVINCVSQKHITYQEGIKLLFSVLKEVPLEGIVWTPHTMLTNNFVLFYILTILWHILPAILIDLILKFSGRQPMLIKLQRKVYVLNCALCYFSLHEWKFGQKNYFSLLSSIPTNNRNTFSFDSSYFDVREYAINCTMGAKRHILHEDLNQLDAVKARNKRICLLVTVLKTFISIGMLLIIYKWIYS
ncbi:putative fatty acyl-CoA reductase CG5065 [Solenopsis invicta]|uniref:putative fatty acyl-CoA reductase CG5065 n=1 Tax=Solenopsis invicta TaxID=13686 RepID=UPI00193CDBC5|nr:putative fatty acyl-CoA reductase CG5065 [Solenopsis invicta]